MPEERQPIDLKIREYFEETRAKYAEGDSQYANMSITGDYGTGKTSLFATCPRPVLIDSFDPGGTKTRVLQPLIDSGDIIVERFEDDDWKKPSAYRAWDKRFQERRRSGIFAHLGTYGMDSATNWVLFLMHHLLTLGLSNTGNHAGAAPYQSDYLYQQLNAGNIMRKDIMPLPCHTIVTSHIHLEKDSLTGKIEAGLLMWGKLAELFPLAFDEKYFMIVNKKASGVEHKLLTKNNSYYKAETRMGGDLFETFEPPDIRALLKKAGKSYEDKPRIL